MVAPAATPPTILAGVITTPSHHDRRHWIRKAATTSDLPSLTLRFVIGRLSSLTRECHMSTDKALLVVAERRLLADLVVVDVPDCLRERATHKTFKFFEGFVKGRFGAQDWVAKVDDDSLVNWARIITDMVQMTVIAQTAEVHAYFGAMRWRLWVPSKQTACGHGANGALLKAFREVKASKQSRRYEKGILPCGDFASAGDVTGPFPYADGSFELLSGATARAAFSSAEAHALLNASVRTRAEDPAVGYLVYVAAAARRLPLVYFHATLWTDMRFWIDLRDEATVPDEHTRWAHRIFNAMHAQAAAAGFKRPSSGVLDAKVARRRDRFACGPCDTVWGWRNDDASPHGATTANATSPVASFRCCARDVMPCEEVRGVPVAERCAQGKQAPRKTVRRFAKARWLLPPPEAVARLLSNESLGPASAEEQERGTMLNPANLAHVHVDVREERVQAGGCLGSRRSCQSGDRRCLERSVELCCRRHPRACTHIGRRRSEKPELSDSERETQERSLEGGRLSSP